jgi:hypothetical protein
MNDERHIVVPVDLHGISSETLETLVRIARLLDRGLLALLIDDVRLQQAADLSFTTEIMLHGARERNLLKNYLSDRQERVMSLIRRELTDLAKFDGVQLQFERASGCRSHSLLCRNDHLDLIFPARQRWQLPPSTYPVASQANPKLCIVLPAAVPSGAILEAASLLLAAGLVRELYILADHSPPKEELKKLYKTGQRICVQSNLEITPATLTRLIRQSPYDLLMLSRACLSEVPPVVLDEALEKSGSMVLAVS